MPQERLQPSEYGKSRETLRLQIAQEVAGDERFVAAWLTGSYGRSETDQVSDLDLTLVVDPAYSSLLCARQKQVGHTTTPERLALFSRFGTPALIHENNHNAPPDGTFTFVLYAGSALMVDWVLRPQTSVTTRPAESVLLFDKAGLPVASAQLPEEQEDSQEFVTEQWAFFWMMAAITIKYILREDHVFVAHWLEELHKISHDIQRRIQHQPWHYRRGSLSQLQVTPGGQMEMLRRLCAKMQALTPQIEQFSGNPLTPPVQEVGLLLSLIDEGHGYAGH